MKEHNNIEVKKKLYNLDKFATNGVYTDTNSNSEPKIRIKELIDYCKNNNIQPEELSKEEYEKFINF